MKIILVEWEDAWIENEQRKINELDREIFKKSYIITTVGHELKNDKNQIVLAMERNEISADESITYKHIVKIPRGVVRNYKVIRRVK